MASSLPSSNRLSDACIEWVFNIVTHSGILTLLAKVPSTDSVRIIMHKSYTTVGSLGSDINLFSDHEKIGMYLHQSFSRSPVRRLQSTQLWRASVSYAASKHSSKNTDRACGPPRCLDPFKGRRLL